VRRLRTRGARTCRRLRTRGARACRRCALERTLLTRAPIPWASYRPRIGPRAARCSTTPRSCRSTARSWRTCAGAYPRGCQFCFLALLRLTCRMSSPQCLTFNKRGVIVYYYKMTRDKKRNSRRSTFEERQLVGVFHFSSLHFAACSSSAHSPNVHSHTHAYPPPHSPRISWRIAHVPVRHLRRRT
jgi:hypothetical protein